MLQNGAISLYNEYNDGQWMKSFRLMRLKCLTTKPFSQVWTHIVCTSKFNLRKSLRWFPTRGLHSIQSLFQLLVLGAILYWNYNSFQKFTPFFIPSFKYVFFVLPQISAKLGDKKLNETEVKKTWETHFMTTKHFIASQKFAKILLSKFSYCIFVHFQLHF